MKHFWLLPATLRLAIAAQRPFSVQNDLLAFPQYEVVFAETFISPADAAVKLKSNSHADIAKRASQEQQVLTDSNSGDDDNLDQYERLLLHERPYLCRIPFVAPEPEENTTTTEAMQAEQQQELMRASDQGWKLLSGLEGSCLFYISGWWVYSFCYNEGVNQFHPLPPTRGLPLFPPTPDPNVPNNSLGKFKQMGKDGKEIASSQDKSSSQSVETDVSAHLQTRGESNYLMQKLGGGTECDLTGKSRTIEVQYHCNPNSGDRIHMIKETAICSYLMVIHTTRLCNEVAFHPPQYDKPNTISCREIVSKEEEADWKRGKAAQASYELFQSEQTKLESESAEKRKKPVVGGIELGGQKVVGGSPERTIKASKVGRPPKPKEEKYIATLASSNGKSTTIMNEQEIRKFDLKDSLDTIEDYIVQTQEWAAKVAPERPWKLDVVQTADGIQYRGILMADDEEDDQNVDSTEETAKHKDKESEGSQEEYKPEKRP